MLTQGAAVHVDVIQTDWAAGVQRLAARASVNGAGLEVTEASDTAFWHDRLGAPLTNDLGDPVTPETDGKTFLELLAAKFSAGTYVFTLEPHEDDQCPFSHARVLTMRELPVPSQPRQPS